MPNIFLKLQNVVTNTSRLFLLVHGAKQAVKTFCHQRSDSTSCGLSWAEIMDDAKKSSVE